jgi:hypothetical protein
MLSLAASTADAGAGGGRHGASPQQDVGGYDYGRPPSGFGQGQAQQGELRGLQQSWDPEQGYGQGYSGMGYGELAQSQSHL